MSVHITVSNQEFYEVLLEDATQGETNWTVNRHVRRSDMMLLYICAPVSAIVATAIIETEPEKVEDPSSPWFGQYMTDMRDLQMLVKPISREELLRQFPTWGYWKQPRNSVRVPDQYVSSLKDLLKGNHA